MKDVLVLTGAGQIGLAIARRLGAGRKIVVGDVRMENAQAAAALLSNAGFDPEPVRMDLAERDSIRAMLDHARTFGDIGMLVNAAGGWQILRAAASSY